MPEENATKKTISITEHIDDLIADLDQALAKI